MFRHCRAALTALICTLSFVAVAANLSPTVSISSPASGLTFTAPASITLKANAADADGTIVNVKFYRGTTLLGTDTSAPYSFAWTNVAAGSYSITAKATDNLGVITTSSVVTVTVAANVAPSVSITSPTAGTTFTAPAAITINANAADINNGTITKVDFYRGATLLGTDTTAPYSYAWTNAAAGSYSITAKATDNSGAVTTSSAVAITVAAPNAVPTVSISSPVAGTSFVAPAAVTINATAADSNGTVSKVDFYNGTTLLGSDTTSPYSFAWANVAVGSYSITSKATDNAGAVTTSAAVAITVTAPNAPPTVSISSPVSGSIFTAPAAIAINATAADSNGTVSKVDFYNGTTLLGSDTTSPYSFAWANVAVGSYSITAKATDNSGAVTTSAAIAVTVAANVPPTVSLTSPASGAVFTTPASITLSANAADANNGSISNVKFYRGATLIGTVTAAPYNFVWSDVTVGSYSITAKATDNSGAVTTSSAVAISVAVPNVAPTISFIAPSADVSSAINSSPIRLAVNAADRDGSISKVEFFSGTTLLGTSTSTPYIFDWVNAPLGTYSISAKATDNQGAIAVTPAVNLTVKATNIVPTISITSPLNGETFVDLPFSIQVNANDTDGHVVKVEYYYTILNDIYFSGYSTPKFFGVNNIFPFSISSQNFTNIISGTVRIFAKVTDDTGATTESIPVNLVITESGNLRILNPTNGAIFGGAPTTINIEFSDPANYHYLIGNEVTLVQYPKIHKLYINGILDEVAIPFLNNNKLTFSTENLTAGDHSVKIKSINDAGIVAVSDEVKFTIKSSNIAPIVEVIKPINGALQSYSTGYDPRWGSPIRDRLFLKANASDFDGTISKVEFYDGPRYLGLATENKSQTGSGSNFKENISYDFTWLNVPVGKYNIIAKATDNNDAITTSNGNIITITQNNISPVVNIVTPDSELTGPAGGKISFKVAAFDVDGSVREIKMYINSILTTSISNLSPSSSEFVFDWYFNTAGTYSIILEAKDNLDAVTASASKIVTISNAPYFGDSSIRAFDNVSNGSNLNYIPPIDILITSDASSVSSTISKVEIYNGLALLGNANYSTSLGRYEFIWSNVPSGIYNLSAKAIDVNGLATKSKSIYHVVSLKPEISFSNPVKASSCPSCAINVYANSLSLEATEVIDVAKFEQVTFEEVLSGGNTKIAEFTNPPYKYNLINLSPGFHKFQVTGKFSNIYPYDDININVLPAASDPAFSPPAVALSVSSSTPSNNSNYVAPATINLSTTVNASVGRTISKVDFYNGLLLIGTATSAPYNFTWSNIPAGSYSLSARATDNTGALGLSATVEAYVTALDIPPSISIINPISGAKYFQPVDIKIDTIITDPDSFSSPSVQIYDGATQINCSTTTTLTTHSCLWSNATLGNHNLVALVTDFRGLVGISTIVPITVETANIAPTVSITSPASATTITNYPASITFTATAADSDGSIAKVEFFSGTTLLGASTTEPYSFFWAFPLKGRYEITAVATDNRGRSTTSNPVVVVVDYPNTAPTISITSPTAGTRFPTAPSNITFTAAAADTDGTVTKVEFFNGSALIGAATAAPFSVVWNSVPNGSYVISAKATDNRDTSTTTPGMLIKVGNAEVITYLHNDFAGSPIAATNSQGNIVWKENYGPYGERLVGQTAAADNRQWFHGKAADADTGLQYFGARYYDPVLGRFMGVDPVGFQEDNIHSFNKYAYGNNNPYRFIDPDGRQSMSIHYNVWNRAFSNSAGPNPNGAKGFEVAKQGMVQGIIDGAILSAEVGMTVSSMGLGGSAKGVAQALSVEGKALLTANPVGSAVKADPAHRAATFMREKAAANGSNFAITGGDGVTRTLTQVPGDFNGVAGRYEYIVDSLNNLTHQMFVRGGSINGVPIKP
jgi:RHS repeat-associated protein